MGQHPRFYLSSPVARAIGLTSKRTPAGNSIEASRLRDSLKYSVICDFDSARQMIESIRQLRDGARARENSALASECDVAIRAVTDAITLAEMPVTIAASGLSDVDRGLLGVGDNGRTVGRTSS